MSHQMEQLHTQRCKASSRLERLCCCARCKQHYGCQRHGNLQKKIMSIRIAGP